MYNLYLNGMLMPVTPSKVTAKTQGNNKTVTLINEGEVNMLKKKKLEEFSFELLLPNQKYPFTNYAQGFNKAQYYEDNLRALLDKQQPFQFILVRNSLTGDNFGNIDKTVTIENLEITDDAKEGTDRIAKVSLKEYVPYGTKTFAIVQNSVTYNSARQASSGAPTTSNSGSTTYIVKSGDTLWSIAKMFYGDGSKYTVIQSANSDKISDPNNLKVGTVLTIPNATTATSSKTTSGSGGGSNLSAGIGIGVASTSKTNQTTSKNSPPYSVKTKSLLPIKTGFASYNAAYAYLMQNNGKSKGWVIVDSQNRTVKS